MSTLNVAQPQPSHAVDRANLRALLDGAMSAPLTLLVAPAGSGKTVLLSQWAASRADLRFVWLEIEQTDDDPAQFLRRLVRGLTAVSPSAHDLGPLLTIGAGGFGRPLLESLVDMLAENSGTVLIFDDLHNLSNRAIIEDLWWLADHLPPGTHLVFSSRVDLRLDWSSHRLRYALLELRQADLAFDSAVVAEVLCRITGAVATTATVSAVMESTEGWAAGVQLTAISLRHQLDPEQFAQHLAGTDRLISDYLSEEVLGAQTEKRRDLLLRMSILEMMSAGLVESVLGIPDAVSLFEELQRDSMFLVPLDNEQEWFRFHHLFRDLLQYRLRARYPDEELRILSAAADWHEQHCELGAAIECHLRARSWERAMDLILTHGREVFERGRAASIARWLSIVPEQDRLGRPLAEVMYGYTLAVTGEAARSEDVLRQVATRPDVERGVTLIAHAFLASLTQFRPSVAISLDTAREALRVLHENADIDVPQLMGLTHPTLLETLALGGLGRAHFLAGDFPHARRWLQATERSPGAQYSAYRIHVLGALALLEAWSGRLARAEMLADEGLELAREVSLLVHPAPADAYLAKALVAIHRGTPQSGGLALHEGTLRAASNRRVPLMWIAHLESVLADGEVERVPSELVVAPPIVRQGLDAAALRAQRLAHRASSPPLASITTPTAAWSPILVEAIAGALTARRTEDARGLLGGVRFEPREDTPIATVEYGVLTAWLADLDGRPQDCRARLSAAVELAGVHGLMSVFLWAGPEVIRLVEKLPGVPGPFRTALLARARERFRPDAVSEMSEPLTGRESELLAYLPSRLTNAELAARLYVSVNTVKTHTAHIYRKLNVPNRSAAVTRATELGLL